MNNYLKTFLLLIFLANLIKSQSAWIHETSFGNNGTSRINFGSAHSDYPNDILLLPDNKILIGGITTSSTEGYFVSMTQLLENGQLDSSNFGIDGKVLIHFVGRDHANVLKLQNDGKILAAGAEANSNASSAITPSLYRFNPNGSLDTTFGNGGRVIQRFTGNSAGSLHGIKVLNDGRILVTGVSTTTNGFGAMRFLPNGQLDTNFGVGGIARINYSLGGHSVASLFLADTAIIMATVDISPTNIVLAMMDSSGNPYTNFGNNGVLQTDIVGKYNFSGGESLALTSDGKILLGCTTPNSSPTNFSVIRFFIDGSIDSTFGTNGTTDIQFGSDNVLYDLKLDTSGKILLVGEASGQAGVIRLNEDGSPDTTFAPEGKFSLDLSIGNGTSYLRSCLPLSNGDILAAGYDHTSNIGDYVVVKLTQNPTGVEYQNSIQPNDFTLYQNYPNPFNPITTIKYSVSVKSYIRLSVYDILGREVSILVNESKHAGNYEIEFDASHLASGIYFYRLQAGSLSKAKRMTLIK
ncbi:MAG: T9SS type A sorting domain-containing protein [Ignavibacteriales bacterium]|nr:T9SS type A sorting domain-containing protein [Ignavibacteriales bacterium]